MAKRKVVEKAKKIEKKVVSKSEIKRKNYEGTGIVSAFDDTKAQPAFGDNNNKPSFA